MLLVSFTSYVDIHPEQPWDLLEFFAGHAAISREAQDQGFKSAALDLEYDCVRKPSRRFRIDKRSPFDINSESGFA